MRLDRRTKDLIRRLRPGDIALIAHRDLDELAARGLERARVRAVINAHQSISGRYPNMGPSRLLQAHIPIVDNVGEGIFKQLSEGDKIRISGGCIFRENKLIAVGKQLTLSIVQGRIAQGQENLQREMELFINNTLKYAAREKRIFLGKIRVPKLPVRIKDRHVLIVARGHDYREDLAAINPYIREEDPVLIGVDGGGDALLELGYTPHYIVGDMDSVSDEVLHCGAHLIVHAYKNGRAPGLARLENLNLQSTLFPAPGTSEDAALLLAHGGGAKLIVAVGLHSNLIDFLEKGRPGMASTLLARLKVGSILIDAKGVNQLYRGGLRLSYVGGVALAGLFPLLIILLISSRLQYFFRLLLFKCRLLVGL